MATDIEIFKEAVKTSIEDKTAEGSILNGDIAARFYDAADLMLAISAQGAVAFEGEATTSTDPGPAAGHRMWLTATAGTYTHFGLTVANGELAFLIDNGTTYTKLVVPVDPVPLTLVQVSGVGKNKLDSSAFVEGNVNSSGVLDAVLPLTGWQRTPRVPVVAGTSYTFSAVGFTPSTSKHVVFYNASNTYLSRVTITSAPPFTFVVPATATNIVINLKEPANSAPTNVQLEIGNVATSYEAYIPPVNAVKDIKTDPVVASYLDDTTGNRAFVTGAINNNITTQNVYSKNILDEENIKTGLVNSSGAILTTAGWLRTDKTPVTAGSVYTFSGLNYTPSSAKILAFYTAGDVYITRVSVTTALPYTFTVPSGAAYFILNLKEPTDANTPSQLQVENENVATSYVPHRKTVVTKILGYDLLGSDSSSVSPASQTQALVNLYPQVYGKLPNFRKRYSGPSGATADDRVKVIMEGDSIFAREMHTTAGSVVPSTYPPTFVTNNIGANLFRSLRSLERPSYARWDKAGTFTETGSWTTETTGWDDSGTRPNDTRLSTTSAAALSFAVAAAYNRFNFVDRTDLAASTSIAIAVTGGAGKVEVKLPGATVWVEANGAVLSQLETAGTRRSNSVYARRVEFRKVGATIGTSVTITLTKAADSTKFLYWGLELISGVKPYVQLVNIARGGNTLAQLSNYIQNDLIERKPNLVLFEIPMLNMVAASQVPSYSVNWVQDFLYGDRVGNTNTWNLKTASNNWTDFEVLCVLPHFAQSHFAADGTAIVQSSGYTMPEIWGAVKAFLYEKGDIPFVDMSAAFVREIETNYLGNYYTAFAGSGVNGNTLSSDGVHPNDRGTALYNKHISPIFDINTY